MKTNKRELLALGLLLVSLFLIGFILFSAMNTDVSIKLENGKVISSKVPVNFSLVSVIFLMLLISSRNLMSSFKKPKVNFF